MAGITNGNRIHRVLVKDFSSSSQDPPFDYRFYGRLAIGGEAWWNGRGDKYAQIRLAREDREGWSRRGGWWLQGWPASQKLATSRPVYNLNGL